jgi:hypothetical protein
MHLGQRTPVGRPISRFMSHPEEEGTDRQASDETEEEDPDGETARLPAGHELAAEVVRHFILFAPR